MESNSSAQLSGRFAWRFCYWTALVAVFAWATWLRFRLPLDPIADPDTWGYLSPALRKLTGAEFGHTNGRNFLYPGFLFLLLRLFGDFRAITVVQQLLGLGAGAIFLLTWRRARVLLAHRRPDDRVYDALGLIGAAIFLCAAEPMHVEMQLRPESVCAFWVSLNIWLVLQFIACSWLENRQIATAIYGIAVVFTAILLASLKPSFAVLALVAAMPVAVFFFRRDRLWQKAAIATGSVLSATLLLLPEHLLSRNDEKSRTFLPATLFTIHANLIRDQMAEDLRRGAQIPYARDRLERVYSALNSEVSKSGAAEQSRYHISAGFSPDYLMYDPTSITAQLRADFRGDISALCAFYRFYYWRTWRYRPLALLQKVGRQMSIFYSWRCPAYYRAMSLPLAAEYERGVKSLDRPAYQRTWSAYAPAVEFMRRTAALARSAPAIQQRAYVRKPLGFLAATYLPLLFVSVGLGAFVLSRETHRRRFRWLAVLVVLLFSYNFAACLEVAVVHLLEYPRYITVQVYFTLLAQFFAVCFVVEFVLEMRAFLLTEKPAASPK
ncbi:MAG TPA: hypothetical protein VIV62_01905 [Chthoniobacterales bacterium]|jgi:hypothetical protein